MLIGWIIWRTDTPYECGKGIFEFDDEPFLSQQIAEEIRVERGLDTDEYCTLQFRECPAE